MAFYLTLLIQKIQDAQFGFNEINTRLIVIEVNQCPRDFLFHVLLLFQFEDMLERMGVKNDLQVLYVLTKK